MSQNLANTISMRVISGLDPTPKAISQELRQDQPIKMLRLEWSFRLIKVDTQSLLMKLER